GERGDLRERGAPAGRGIAEEAGGVEAEAEAPLHADRRDELVAGDERAHVLPFERGNLLAELVELLDAVAVEVLPDELAELLPDADVDLLQDRRALGLRLVDRVQLDGAL